MRLKLWLGLSYRHTHHDVCIDCRVWKLFGEHGPSYGIHVCAPRDHSLGNYAVNSSVRPGIHDFVSLSHNFTIKTDL
jgi:hypothetical protein